MTPALVVALLSRQHAEPLLDGAYFNVRFLPAAIDQELPAGSDEPVNKERTEFLLKAKLPETVVPGEWHAAILQPAAWMRCRAACDFRCAQ